MILSKFGSSRKDTASLGLFVAFLIANLIKLLSFRHAISAGGMNLPNFIFTTVVLGSLVLLIWPFLILNARGILFWPAFILQAIYIFINLSYYIYYGTWLTISTSIALFSEVTGVAAGGGIPFRIGTLLLTIADLPLAIAIFLFRLTALNTIRSLPRIVHLSATVATVLALSAAIIFRAIDDPFLYTIGRAVFRPSQAVKAFGLLPYQIGSYFNNERSLEGLIAAMEPAGPTHNFPERYSRSDIVVIQVESLGSDILGARSDGKAIMPYLERLTNESIFFPYSLVYHKGGGTSDTEVAVISSTETIANYPAANLPLDYRNSFVKSLKAEGYSTVIYHGNNASYFNRGTSFPAMGFDRFESLETMGIKSAGWGAPDQEVFSFIADDIKVDHRPFLRYVITMSSHGPYTNVPKYYEAPFKQDGLSDIEARYNTSMSYVDAELERAIANFKANGADYIIIFGDHPDYYVEGNDRSRERSTITFDGVKMKFTPLFIITPDGTTRHEKAKVASLLDIGPTILSASGIPGSIITWGENLLESEGPVEPIIFNGRKYDRQTLFNAVAAISGKAIER